MTQQLRHWFINSQGQTLVVINGPVEFLMGEKTEKTEPKKKGSVHSHGGSSHSHGAPAKTPTPVVKKSGHSHGDGKHHSH